ncbi:hypothetical protein F8388_002511 [Cannabis sativa]|uniref:Ethylene insensitive 3-like DNA-binding domain-containing protein n=1 Tax=Cannabis sativa TaxID=3483 RepID=A0A7J6DW99_CANSA|nr:hypothetical protein F8388_002511 [Cannabis sativa]KAF4400037.1 hypothetical protein G4B88_021251 [Cannabis sativa]
MGIFEEMGFSGNFEFVSAPPREADEALEHETEPVGEEDYSDEEMDVDELERRMWRDRMLLRRLKEQNKGKQGVDNAKQRQSQEQARRKKMSRAQDGILKYMLKMMEVCKAQGFVYGIIPEKGKPVSGASDNLRAWWKEKVRFDRNGPAAISKYQADHSIPGVNFEPNVEVEECKPRDVSFFNMGAVAGRDAHLMQPPVIPKIKGELVEMSSDFVQKRKPLAEESQSQMRVDHKIYTCENLQCPYHNYRLGFLDRTSRNNHQMNCPYRSNTSSQAFGMSSFQISNDKPAAFSMPQSQPKPHPPPAAPMNQATQLNVSGLGLPEDGQKMISELMSFYDTNISPPQTKNLNSGNFSATDSHIPSQQNYQFQMEDNFYNQGVMGSNTSEQANVSSSPHVGFPMSEAQFDNQCKAFDSSFDNNPTDNIVDLRFSSPFHLPPVEYTVDPLPKQDSLWFL